MLFHCSNVWTVTRTFISQLLLLQWTNYNNSYNNTTATGSSTVVRHCFSLLSCVNSDQSSFFLHYYSPTSNNHFSNFSNNNTTIILLRTASWFPLVVCELIRAHLLLQLLQLPGKSTDVRYFYGGVSVFMMSLFCVFWFTYSAVLWSIFFSTGPTQSSSSSLINSNSWGPQWEDFCLPRVLRPEWVVEVENHAIVVENVLLWFQL